jgi:hypothetical protein
LMFAQQWKVFTHRRSFRNLTNNDYLSGSGQRVLLLNG